MIITMKNTETREISAKIDELLDALNIHHTLRIRRDGRIIEIERARR